MKYYVEKLDKFFDSAAEAMKAEEMYNKKLAEEKAKKEELANTRKARADEVEKLFADAREAQKKANDALTAFCKDYGAFHKTYKEGETVPSLWDWFLNWF